MIKFGPMSITLLLCAAQGLVLAWLLSRSKRNRLANRCLAVLILAVAALLTPYIIGYAGFYDRWPRLSFAPFSYTLAFGPLIYFYTTSLVDRPPVRAWPHFIPVFVQFLADAVVFPLPLATKDWWDAVANESFISPILEIAGVLSLSIYGVAAFRQYRRYRHWLDENRADGVDLDPSWIRNFLTALAVVVLAWFGFMAANWLDPSRDYFDQFLLYLIFSGLVLYLGIVGWRHSETAFPPIATSNHPDEPADLDEPTEPDTRGRDWAAQGRAWLARLDAEQYWRDSGLTLATLARKLGTNTAYLSRALKAATGDNFNVVINRRRVQEVQRLLNRPGEGRSLLELAFESGFNSKASFNRAFANFAGMSPSAWRLKSQKVPSV